MSITTAPPWYRQAWPWFLILLPFAAVVASFITLFIALTHQDALVRDDYYQSSMAINRDLVEEDRARALGLAARLEYEHGTGVLTIQVSGPIESAGSLSLDIVHPTDAARDQALRLRRIGDFEFDGSVTAVLDGKRYLLLRGIAADGVAWRLRGTFYPDAPSQKVALLPAG